MLRPLGARATKHKRRFRSSLKRRFSELARRRPTLPHSCPCSTIGSEKLDYRVRDGIGYDLLDIATGNLWASSVRTDCSDCIADGRARVLAYALHAPRARSSQIVLSSTKHSRRESSPELRARISICALEDMAKPHGRLVPVSSTPHGASTPGLSTWSSPRGLQAALPLREGSSSGGFRA